MEIFFLKRSFENLVRENLCASPKLGDKSPPMESLADPELPNRGGQIFAEIFERTFLGIFEKF